MAVQDLWLSGRRHTKRYGRGRRWRVVVAGYPTRSFERKAEAEAYEARLRLGVGHVQVSAGPVTVGELVMDWLAGKRGLSPKGVAAAGYAAALVTGRWGETEVSAVRASDIQAWIAGMGLSSSARHKALQSLSGALRIGVERGLVDRNAADGVRVPPQPRREGIFLDLDQLRSLADAAGGYGPMVWLLGTVGLRVGEACSLDVGDVQPDQHRLRVHRSKTGRGRDVSVPLTVMAMLPLSGRERSEPLFTSPTGCRVIVGTWRARVFRPAAASAGLDGLRIHDLRHTAASLMIAAGADVKVVQRQLGHKSATMTLDLYGHLWDRALDDVGLRIDSAITGSRLRVVAG